MEQFKEIYTQLENSLKNLNITIAPVAEVDETFMTEFFKTKQILTEEDLKKLSKQNQEVYNQYLNSLYDTKNSIEENPTDFVLNTLGIDSNDSLGSIVKDLTTDLGNTLSSGNITNISELIQKTTENFATKIDQSVKSGNMETSDLEKFNPKNILNNPKVQKMLKDPQVKKMMESPMVQNLMKNPQELLNNPEQLITQLTADHRTDEEKMDEREKRRQKLRAKWQKQRQLRSKKK